LFGHKLIDNPFPTTYCKRLQRNFKNDKTYIWSKRWVDFYNIL